MHNRLTRRNLLRQQTFRLRLSAFEVTAIPRAPSKAFAPPWFSRVMQTASPPGKCKTEGSFVTSRRVPITAFAARPTPAATQNRSKFSNYESIPRIWEQESHVLTYSRTHPLTYSLPSVKLKP